MGFGNPIGAGVLRIGMAEGNVHAGNFLVLQDVPDYPSAGGIGSDGELADAIAILIRARVGTKFVEQFPMVAGETGDPAVCHLDPERGVVQVAIFAAKVIAHHAIDDKDAVRV
jgi:hypothetical protein